MQETSWTAAWIGGGVAWKEPNIPSKKSAVLKFWKYRINLTGKRNCLQFYRLKKEKKKVITTTTLEISTTEQRKLQYIKNQKQDDVH